MEKYFLLLICLIVIIIIGLSILSVILHILDKNLDIREKKHNEFINKGSLKYIISHLENISDNVLEIASTKLTDEDKLRFVNEILPGIDNYLKMQIIELKKVRDNATNIK